MFVGFTALIAATAMLAVSKFRITFLQWKFTVFSDIPRDSSYFQRRFASRQKRGPEHEVQPLL